MGELIFWILAATLVAWAYKSGKHYGSKGGFRAGRRVGRRDPRSYRRR